MKQFNLSEWLQDKSRKVVTRDGREVRILCIDCGIRKSQPILVEITCSRNTKVLEYYNIDGTTQDKNLNLFFADEEEKPQSIEIPFGAKDSEFIKDEYYIPEGCEARIEGNKVVIEKIQKEELTEFENELINLVFKYKYWDSSKDKVKQGIKKDSKLLLDIARKELKEILTTDAYNQGRENALKDLPKWKKAKKDEELDCHVVIQQDDRVVLSDFVQKDEYYITLDVLKKLPKEE